MRLGIIGSRKFNDREFAYEKLDALHAFYKFKTVVSGGARGADSIGSDWASARGLDALIFLPEYEKYGRSAPFRRNTDIVENSDIIVAFWDGKSTGTKDSLEKAKVRGVITKIYYVGLDHETQRNS